MNSEAARILACLVGLKLAAGCSDGGSSPAKETATSEDSDSGETQEAPTSALTGKVVLAGQSSVAHGYQTLLMDHTVGSFLRQEIAADGSFSFPAASFERDHTYSLAVLSDNYRIVGNFDMRPAVDGCQCGFSLDDSGLGSDLGTNTISVDKFGDIDPESTSLGGYLDGGFSIVTGDYSLRDFRFPDSYPHATVGVRLNPKSSIDILEAFYLSNSRPERYRQVLLNSLQLEFNVETQASTKFRGAKLEAGPDWLFSAYRVDDSADSQNPWRQYGHEVEKLTDFSGRSAIIGQSPMIQQSFLELNIFGGGGDSFHEFLVIDRVFSQIPKIETITLNGSAVSSLDYESSSAENGLTRPFLWSSGNIVIAVTSPLDAEGKEIVTDEIAKIVAKLTYYADDLEGVLTEVPKVRGDYSEPFNKKLSVGTSGGIARRWDPDVNEMTYLLDADILQGESTFNLEIDDGILLLGGDDVARVKVQITFRTAVDEASTLMWISKPITY